MTTEIKFSHRLYILTLICTARTHYFRLKRELADFNTTLPSGTWLGTYTSNSHGSKHTEYPLAPYIYHVLAHRDKILPNAKKDGKPIGKHSLGRISNARYLKGVLALEKMYVYNAKLQTLERVTLHLQELKKIYKDSKMKESWSDVIILDKESFDSFLRHDPLDQYL